MDIRETSIGNIGIAVAVHPTNCVDELTIDQVYKIFDGTFTTWKPTRRGKSINLHTNPWHAESKITGYLSQARPGAPVRQIASYEKQSLEKSNEVALVQVRDTESQPTMKFLAIKKEQQSAGVLPSMREVSSGNYPFIQPLYLYIDWHRATDQAKAFFTFCATQKSKAAGK